MNSICVCRSYLAIISCDAVYTLRRGCTGNKSWTQPRALESTYHKWIKCTLNVLCQIKQESKQRGSVHYACP